ncbi:MAG TPA: GNAT family N-acetyltransferase [Labilithrix sp.]|nr:GNAT family N-acetyltransferase [Labilithrix sp.]
MTTILTTPRLRLEPFADAHVEQLHEMNSDLEVMRYITGRPQTLEETRASIERVKARWAEWGYSWWSFFELETGRIIGAGCIQHLDRDAANPLELGFRLRRDKWHQGFASEAARAMAAFAFETLEATQLTAICHPNNTASAQVMLRLGMSYRGIERWYEEDWAVYAMSRSDWQKRL